MKQHSLYIEFIKNNNKSFILFCSTILCIFISYIFCRGASLWKRILCRSITILLLISVIYINLNNVNTFFSKTNNIAIQKNLLWNYLFIVIIFLFIVFLITHLTA